RGFLATRGLTNRQTGLTQEDQVRPALNHLMRGDSSSDQPPSPKSSPSPLNWAQGLDSNGRPIPEAAGNDLPAAGRVTKPGDGGGTNGCSAAPTVSRFRGWAGGCRHSRARTDSSTLNSADRWMGARW